MFHVTARGNRREPIFTCDIDADRFLAHTADVVKLLGWQCLEYCLMPNHYHLLIETPRGDLSAGMHRLNGSFARWFNRRYGFVGHVFERRFHSLLIESTPHFLEATRYILLNPVRAHLCRSPSEWRWSSYRATAGLEPQPDFLGVDRLLAQFGTTRERARTTFLTFTHDVPEQPPRVHVESP